MGLSPRTQAQAEGEGQEEKWVLLTELPQVVPLDQVQRLHDAHGILSELLPPLIEIRVPGKDRLSKVWSPASILEGTGKLGRSFLVEEVGHLGWALEVILFLFSPSLQAFCPL